MPHTLIRAASYNVGLLKILTRDIVPLVSARAEILPNALRDYVENRQINVLLIQEAWSDRIIQPILMELAASGFTWIIPEVSGWYNSGLILAVRAPFRIQQHHFQPYLSSASSDQWAKKGILVAELAHPSGQRFNVLGTHMQCLATRNGTPRNLSEVRAHAAQIEQLRHCLSEPLLGKRLPTIVLGDFNVGPSYLEEHFDSITRIADLKHAYLAVNPQDFDKTWDPLNPLVQTGWNSVEPPALIDHCFVRDSAGGTWIPISGNVAMKETYPGIRNHRRFARIPLSDHYALETVLELRAEGAEWRPVRESLRHLNGDSAPLLSYA